jgi:hypothetical protein
MHIKNVLYFCTVVLFYLFIHLSSYQSICLFSFLFLLLYSTNEYDFLLFCFCCHLCFPLCCHLYFPLCCHLCFPLCCHLCFPLCCHLYFPLCCHLCFPLCCHLTEGERAGRRKDISENASLQQISQKHLLLYHRYVRSIYRTYGIGKQ